MFGQLGSLVLGFLSRGGARRTRAGRTVGLDVSLSDETPCWRRTGLGLVSQAAHREPTGASASLRESFKPESTRASGALRATVSCFSRETLSGCLSEVGRARRENGGGRALLP